MQQHARRLEWGRIGRRREARTAFGPVAGGDGIAVAVDDQDRRCDPRQLILGPIAKGKQRGRRQSARAPSSNSRAR